MSHCMSTSTDLYVLIVHWAFCHHQALTICCVLLHKSTLCWGQDGALIWKAKRKRHFTYQGSQDKTTRGWKTPRSHTHTHTGGARKKINPHITGCPPWIKLQIDLRQLSSFIYPRRPSAHVQRTGQHTGRERGVEHINSFLTGTFHSWDVQALAVFSTQLFRLYAHTLLSHETRRLWPQTEAVTSTHDLVCATFAVLHPLPVIWHFCFYRSPDWLVCRRFGQSILLMER